MGRGPRPPSRAIGLAALLYCAAVLGFLAIESPRLWAARLALGFPPVSYFAGVPVAVYGIYFYTAASAGAGLVVARLRKAPWRDAIFLAALGVAGYEAVYGVAYAVLQGSPDLLLPALGLPLAGWPGLASWGLVEGLVASLAVYRWRWWGLDRWVVLAVAGFAASMIAWKVLLGLEFPPYATDGLVYPINTAAELSGSIWLPLIATVRRPGTTGDREEVGPAPLALPLRPEASSVPEPAGPA